MSRTFADRYTVTQPQTGHAAGFVVEDLVSGTETLYAALISGRMLKRTDTLGCDEFNVKGADWRKVDAIPANAVWVGNYPGPYRYDAVVLTEVMI